MLSLYNAVLHAGLLFGLLAWPLGFIFRRDRYRGLRERFTAYPPELVAALAGSRPIWIHAASVGEVRSAAPLVRRIRMEWPDRKLLVSTVTVTGRQTVREALPDVDGVTYLPLDLPWLVSRSLRRLRPALIILLETEIWPNFIRVAHRLRIPTVVLSGRLSPRGARMYKRFRKLFRPVLDEVAGFGMQDDENAGRVLRLGVDPLKVTVTGSLKYAAPEPGPFPEPPDVGKGRGPVVVAGSTHRGEEEIFLGILPELCGLYPGLLMILAPRHPERFGEVERLLRERKLRYLKRSEMSGPAIRGLWSPVAGHPGRLAAVLWLRRRCLRGRQPGAGGRTQSHRARALGQARALRAASVQHCRDREGTVGAGRRGRGPRPAGPSQGGRGSPVGQSTGVRHGAPRAVRGRCRQGRGVAKHETGLPATPRRTFPRCGGVGVFAMRKRTSVVSHK